MITDDQFDKLFLTDVAKGEKLSFVDGVTREGVVQGNSKCLSSPVARARLLGRGKWRSY
jgi:hypothetical protein